MCFWAYNPDKEDKQNLDSVNEYENEISDLEIY